MCVCGGGEAKHNNNKQKLGSALLVQKIHLHVLLFGVSSFFHLYMHFILVEYYLLISVLCWKLLHLCCLLTHTPGERVLSLHRIRREAIFPPFLQNPLPWTASILGSPSSCSDYYGVQQSTLLFLLCLSSFGHVWDIV